MTNLCTKVTVRKRPIKNGQTSLYLDFYPPIRNPKTGRLSRREYLGLYIYSNPTEKFQQEYNRSIMQKAELIKCRRTESIINEEFGFLDRSKGQESFLDYSTLFPYTTLFRSTFGAVEKTELFIDDGLRAAALDKLCLLHDAAVVLLLELLSRVGINV